MGLAEPKRSKAIATDPRNTAWTSTTASRFGHKHLSSLGWSPGQNLGSEVTSKWAISNPLVAPLRIPGDENFGVGAKVKNDEDTCTGLDDLQNILGRLNGRSEEMIRKEERLRVGLRGAARWVYGGLLAGTIEEGLPTDGTSGDSKKSAKATKERKKKRTRRDLEQDMEDLRVEGDAKKRRARNVKVKSLKTHVSASEGSVEAVIESSELSCRLSSIKKKNKAKNRAIDLGGGELMDIVTSTNIQQATLVPRKIRKSKETREDYRSGNLETVVLDFELTTVAPVIATSPESDIYSKGASAPSGISSPVGRQAVRARWIEQKRRAVMDVKALNEILMIKAQ